MARMTAAAVRVLELEGVRTAFGVPGTAINPFYAAMRPRNSIRHILARHVEGASHMAEGYTRAGAGNIGVCIGTSGPAGTDMITGLYSAWADSIPILCVTGQAPRARLHKEDFQAVDSHDRNHGGNNAMKVGFIGLGIMGRPMAGHLQKAGHELYLNNIGGVPDGLLQGGGRACASGREVAEQAEVVIIMVPDTPHVEAVLFAGGGVAEGLSPGKVVVDMSSIAPVATKEFARRVNALGCDYLDAPVSGGDVGAKAASLTIMVGGPEQAFAKVKPLFELMGKNITLVGANGDGQTTKVANQIIVALTIEAVGEALLFASKAGADPARVRKALMGGFANSRILEVHGQRMVERNFAPGFRIELHQKDLNLALQGAKSLGISLPNTATCQELFNACAAHGGSAWDHSAMVRALEIMANHEVAASGELRDKAA